MATFCAGVRHPMPSAVSAPSTSLRVRRSSSASSSSTSLRVRRALGSRGERSDVIYRGAAGENNEVKFTVDRGNKFRPLYWSLPEGENDGLVSYDC